MNLDYEAAGRAWAERIPFSISWDSLSDKGKAAHVEWATIVVDAAVPEPCPHGYREPHPVTKSIDLAQAAIVKIVRYCDGKPEADKPCQCFRNKTDPHPFDIKHTMFAGQPEASQQVVKAELPDDAEWDAYQPRTIQEAWDEIRRILRTPEADDEV